MGDMTKLSVVKEQTENRQASDTDRFEVAKQILGLFIAKHGALLADEAVKLGSNARLAVQRLRWKGPREARMADIKTGGFYRNQTMLSAFQDIANVLDEVAACPDTQALSDLLEQKVQECPEVDDVDGD